MVLVFGGVEYWAFHDPRGVIALALLGVLLCIAAAVELVRFTFARELGRAQRSLLVATIAAPAVVPALLLLQRHDLLRDPLTAAPPLLAFSGVFLSLLLAPFALFLFGRERAELLPRLIGTVPSGILLIGLGGASWLSVLLLEHGEGSLLWIIAVVASCDTAAYFGGRALKGPKLAPAISPGKTVSGTCCGAVAGGAMSLILLLCGLGVLKGDNWLSAVLIGCFVAIASQGGDLWKSTLKRVSNVKDSGTILPGHGGVLDRVDGYLLGSAALVVFLWLTAASAPFAH